MAKELRTGQEQEFENKYYSIFKIIRNFEARIKHLYKEPGYLGIKCPYCGFMFKETYIFYKGQFRINLECMNSSCGFGCNSWNADDLQSYLDKFEKIRSNECFYESDEDELPF